MKEHRQRPVTNRAIERAIRMRARHPQGPEDTALLAVINRRASSQQIAQAAVLISERSVPLIENMIQAAMRKGNFEVAQYFISQLAEDREANSKIKFVANRIRRLSSEQQRVVGAVLAESALRDSS